MQGSGNDFILIDNRRGVLKGKKLRDIATAVCDRHYSVGADGLIVIVPSKKADFKWRFFKAAGSEAGMCGHGVRGAARVSAAVERIAGSPLRFAFSALPGPVRTRVLHSLSTEVSAAAAFALTLNAVAFAR